MPIIEVSTIIRQDKRRVYELIRDMERFPSFMKDIKRLDIIKRSGIWRYSETTLPLTYKYARE